STSPASSQPGYYRVTTQPENVNIFIDNVLSHATGMLPAGDYALRVEKEGYHPQTRKITIRSDRLVEIRVRLWPVRMRVREYNNRYDFKLRPTTGSLIVSSDPPGLPVSLNDQDKGITPLRIDGVPTGTHRLTIGEVSGAVDIDTYEVQRLRLEKGTIRDVTQEIYESSYEAIALRNLALFMEANETLVRHCANFRNRRGANVFRLATAEMFLVVRMIFRNSSDAPISLPLYFSIYRGSSLLSRAQHVIRLDPTVDHDWCYYHYDDWKSGEYKLVIHGADGHRWGEIHFRVHRE
ncbi:MAG: PEGA domain-containing protein, partial [candidate division KSB1 bacterium]|nr:PEGA domain-containing protein [candidate division KSB1 bacterium]